MADPNPAEADAPASIAGTLVAREVGAGTALAVVHVHGRPDADGHRAVPERLEYKPALDGVRALAIIAVMVFHNSAGVGLGRGGFLGVDVFFVLSGFLITSLLLVDHAHTGHVVSGRFWARRARRLLPALFVLLLLQALIAIFIAGPWELNRIRDGSLATLFYVNNYWLLISHSNTKDVVLGHTWSLAIEEQFYLVWPLLLALILRFTRGSTAWILAVLGALIAVSTALMVWLYSPTSPYPAYQRIDTRAHSLLVGAVLAFLLLGWQGPVRRWARIALEVAGIVALGGLVLLVLDTEFFTAHWLFYGGYLLVAVASAALIAAAIQPSSPILGRVLAIRPLVAIGLISYGLYLFHVPVNRILDANRVGFGGFRLFLVRLAVTVPIAIASYFLVEMPVRRGALTRARMRIVVPAVAALLVAFLVATTVQSRPINSTEASRLSYQRLAGLAPSGSAKVLVVGNGALVFSIGNQPSTVLTRDGVLGTTASIYGCSIVSGAEVESQRAACADWPHLYRNAVDAFEPDVTVLAIGASEVFDRVEHGRKLVVGTPAFESYMLGRLEQARRVLTRHGARLMLLTAPCGPDPQRVAWVNGVLRHFASAHPASVQMGDYAAFACPNGVVSSFAGLPLFGTNGVSLTPTGASATWAWLARTPLIAAAVAENRGKV